MSHFPTQLNGKTGFRGAVVPPMRNNLPDTKKEYQAVLSMHDKVYKVRAPKSLELDLAGGEYDAQTAGGLKGVMNRQYVSGLTDEEVDKMLGYGSGMDVDDGSDDEPDFRYGGRSAVPALLRPSTSSVASDPLLARGVVFDGGSAVAAPLPSSSSSVPVAPIVPTKSQGGRGRGRGKNERGPASEAAVTPNPASATGAAAAVVAPRLFAPTIPLAQTPNPGSALFVPFTTGTTLFQPPPSTTAPAVVDVGPAQAPRAASRGRSRPVLVDGQADLTPQPIFVPNTAVSTLDQAPSATAVAPAFNWNRFQAVALNQPVPADDGPNPLIGAGVNTTTTATTTTATPPQASAAFDFFDWSRYVNAAQNAPNPPPLPVTTVQNPLFAAQAGGVQWRSLPQTPGLSRLDPVVPPAPAPAPAPAAAAAPAPAPSPAPAPAPVVPKVATLDDAVLNPDQIAQTHTDLSALAGLGDAPTTLPLTLPVAPTGLPVAAMEGGNVPRPKMGTVIPGSSDSSAGPLPSSRPLTQDEQRAEVRAYHARYLKDGLPSPFSETTLRWAGIPLDSTSASAAASASAGPPVDDDEAFELTESELAAARQGLGPLDPMVVPLDSPLLPPPVEGDPRLTKREQKKAAKAAKAVKAAKKSKTPVVPVPAPAVPAASAVPAPIPVAPLVPKQEPSLQVVQAPVVPVPVPEPSPTPAPTETAVVVRPPKRTQPAPGPGPVAPKRLQIANEAAPQPAPLPPIQEALGRDRSLPPRIKIENPFDGDFTALVPYAKGTTAVAPTRAETDVAPPAAAPAVEETALVPARPRRRSAAGVGFEAEGDVPGTQVTRSMLSKLTLPKVSELLQLPPTGASEEEVREAFQRIRGVLGGIAAGLREVGLPNRPTMAKWKPIATRVLTSIGLDPVVAQSMLEDQSPAEVAGTLHEMAQPGGMIEGLLGGGQLALPPPPAAAATAASSNSAKRAGEGSASDTDSELSFEIAVPQAGTRAAKIQRPREVDNSVVGGGVPKTDADRLPRDDLSGLLASPQGVVDYLDVPSIPRTPEGGSMLWLRVRDVLATLGADARQGQPVESIRARLATLFDELNETLPPGVLKGGNVGNTLFELRRLAQRNSPLFAAIGFRRETPAETTLNPGRQRRLGGGGGGTQEDSQQSALGVADLLSQETTDSIVPRRNQK